MLYSTNVNAVLRDVCSVNLGSVYESMVAQELHAHGFALHYYDNKQRGGSWKDPISYIRSAWRTWEYQNQPRSYIGFRCVRSKATTVSSNAAEKKRK